MAEGRTVRLAHIRPRAVPIAAVLLLMAFAVGAEDEWTSIGPEGGWVSSLAIDPLTTHVLYAGTQLGGVFKSENGGETWSTSGLQGTLFPRLLGHPQDPQTLYATAAVYAKTGGRVSPNLYRSQDGEKSWDLMNESGFEEVALDPRDSLILYSSLFASGSQTIQKSEDGGRNWQSINTDLPYATIVVDPENSQLLYAGTGEGVFKSENGGEDWTGLPASRRDVFALAIDPQNPQVLYASTYGGGVYKTADGGDSWTSIDAGLPNSEIRIAPAPDDAQRLYAYTDDGRLYRSEDGGDSWSIMDVDLGTRTPALVMDPQDSQRLYAAGTRGALRSADGGTTWAWINSRLAATWVYQLAFDKANPQRLEANTSNGIYTTEDRGDSWTEIESPTLSVRVVVDPADPQTMYRIDFELSKSEDGGETWTRLDLDGGVRELLIDPDNPQTLYVVGEFGNASGVSRSDDGGETWVFLANGLPRTSWGVDAVSVANGMVIDPENSRRLYAATGQGVYTSEDRGGSWTATGLTTGFVEALLLKPDGTTLYAGTDQGVYRSMDGGTGWTAINTKLTNTFVTTLSLDPLDPRTLYAGTQGSSVFRISLSDDTAILVDEVANLPDFFKLHQNFPNPFNTSTVIRIAIPERQVVDLSIYNLAGQKVATLLSEQAAGTYSLHWNGQDDDGTELASGVYVYRLQTGERVKSRRLLLLK